MRETSRILVINGSYRHDGITDQAIDAAVQALSDAAALVDVIHLRDYPIEFCLNCRECTQHPGTAPGRCVHQDGMQALVNKIEQADGYILAAPTNFGSVSAIFKRFMERLIVYAYWPWDKNYPEFRKTGQARKKAILISSSAAPGLLGRWIYTSIRQLRMTAKTIGADTLGVVFTGLTGKQQNTLLPAKSTMRVRQLALKLVASVRV